MSFMKECSDPHLGSYDMRIDTTDMPKSLAIKLNSHICNKGGGNTQTTTTGVPDEFKPYLETGLRIGEARLSNLFDDQGQLKPGVLESVVAGFDPTQTQGQEAQIGLAEQAIEGTGIYNTEELAKRQLENLQGNLTAQSLGNLSSARGQRSMDAALLDKGMDFVTLRQQQAEGGAQSLQDVGATRQEMEQRYMDAPKEELGFYSQATMGNLPQEQTTTGGGGK